MALQSAFKERLGDMEITRNQRLSLLQDEKELQRKKSLLLSGKHAKIRSLEQNCLMLDHKLASDNFKISSLKSLIEFLDRKYQTSVQQLRDLKVEIEELVQLEKERDKFYSLNCSEMNEFKKKVDKSAEEIGCKVKDLRSAKDKIVCHCEFHLSSQAPLWEKYHNRKVYERLLLISSFRATSLIVATLSSWCPFGDLQSKEFLCHPHKGNTNRFVLFVFALYFQ
ncbi:uncharacterized protein LOC130814474 isoform X2 [Amaranthus tricolor]|uniref:uncharacterized protein LOC130814474 isoform X2 n=1 Tax=Amaranthus tricolor TaxID=29722 RepID=UPI00258F46A1|nr:uncharacterized protein LOC130814474 isoform X2 [Amaranthus tricolor]